MSSSGSESGHSSSSESEISSSEESENNSPVPSATSFTDDDEAEEHRGDGNLIYRPRKVDLEECYKSVDNDREIYRPSQEKTCEQIDIDDSGSENDGDCSDDDSAAASCAATAAPASNTHTSCAPELSGASRPQTATGRRKRKARVTVNLDMCDYTVITKARHPRARIPRFQGPPAASLAAAPFASQPERRAAPTPAGRFAASWAGGSQVAATGTSSGSTGACPGAPPEAPCAGAGPEPRAACADALPRRDGAGRCGRHAGRAPVVLLA